MAGRHSETLTWGGSRSLSFEDGPRTMGIVNCTPDSFFPDSRRPSMDEAVDAATAMLEAGADMLDVGGESTRPGADYVSADDERRRVVPVVEAIRSRSEVVISVDTRKSSVAEAALDAGADIVNDVSGLRDDPALADLVASRGVPVVIMHMRGSSKTMQKRPHYDDTIDEIRAELSERIEFALSRGVKSEQIILDPGVGFGKRLGDNLRIIANLGKIKALGFPVLAGISRKSFMDGVLGRAVEDRLAGTLAAEAFALTEGADILRVHDVQETVDLIKMFIAIRREKS